MIDSILSRLDNARPTGTNQWQARCPAHDDRTASLCVGAGEDGRTLLHCQAGCSLDAVLAAVNLEKRDLFPPKTNSRPAKKQRGKCVATYDYCDEAGNLLFQKLRFEPKDFRQRKPDGRGGWSWSVRGVRDVPFLLRQIVAAPGQPVVVVEGEKDAVNVARLGLLATTCAGGAKKWTPEHSQYIPDRSVAILPDNDEPGRAHALTVARSLVGIAKSIKIVELPNLPAKGDVSDWLAAGGTKEQLIEIIRETPEWVPTDDETASDHADAVELDLPEVALPGGETSILECATTLGELCGATGRYHSRGGVPFRSAANGEGAFVLQPIKPATACSEFERVAKLVKKKTTDEGIVTFPATCSESAARLIIESTTFCDQLPPIRLLASAPVLIERGGELLQVDGYDRESGIMTTGSRAPEVELRDAVEMLRGLYSEFKFATPGDYPRAVAAAVTPGLVFGGLLGARAPIDVAEADQSQAGKGVRIKLTASIYGATLHTVTQRPSGGVGSIQESFDAAVIAGAQFISLDNFRGRIDVPGIESFTTEDRYQARIPYHGSIDVDPRRTIIMFTSNKAELTPDLANRSSIVRIQKMPPDYVFRQFPEGDLLDHVRANQPRYLGAVFAVIREWHRRGKPTKAVAGHDFRRWAAVLSYIVADIVKVGDLLAGHRSAQERVASPGLNWARDVALAIHRAGKAGDWLRPHHLLRVIVDAGIETQGVDLSDDFNDDTKFTKATRVVGQKLSTLFTDDTLLIDGYRLDRRKGTDDKFRPRVEYCVTADCGDDAERYPEPILTPEPTPKADLVNPRPPNHFNTLTHACAHTHVSEVLDPFGGSGVVRGDTPVPPESSGKTPPGDYCDHDYHNEPQADGRLRRACSRCGKFFGYLPTGAT